MRLTEDQVRQGLQHSDKDVRFAVLQYFANSFSKNTAIMSDVIGLVERLGPQDAFLYSFPISDLAQTDETIRWAVKQLQRLPASKEDNFTSHVGRLLCRADPTLVLPHKAAIFSLPDLDQELTSRLERRLGLVSTPADQLWQRLEAICEAGKDKTYPNEIPYAEAEDIADALARDVSQADRMMQLLNHEFDPDTATALTWLEIFLVQIAGNMRYEPAIPLLIKKFFVDGEILNEECDKALTKIGTDSVVQAVRDAYPQAPNHFRLYSSGIFGDIHSDLALSAGLELLSLELDPDQRTWLANALVDQFSTEAIDAARTVLREDHSDSYDLKSSLVVACKLMAYDVPELKEWERALAEPRRLFAGREVPSPDFDEVDDLDNEGDVTPIPQRVGRNDPCPCGSGKKYKKCCYGKDAALEETDEARSAALSVRPIKPPPKFPIGTVALYGPDDRITTKIVAGIIKRDGAEAIIERWVGTNIKGNPKVQRQIKEFFDRHGVKSVVATETNFGCPHEEGLDFPMGEDCPFCPHWAGKQGSNRRD